MHNYCIVNQTDILYNKNRSIDLTTKTITKYRGGHSHDRKTNSS